MSMKKAQVDFDSIFSVIFFLGIISLIVLGVIGIMHGTAIKVDSTGKKYITLFQKNYFVEEWKELKN